MEPEEIEEGDPHSPPSCHLLQSHRLVIDNEWFPTQRESLAASLSPDVKTISSTKEGD